MEWVIWVGAALTVAGVTMLLACVVIALRVRRSAEDEAALKARLQGLVAMNLGALALSALGLMAVIVGIFLT